jgi:hypothetical protein
MHLTTVPKQITVYWMGVLPHVSAAALALVGPMSIATGTRLDPRDVRAAEAVLEVHIGYQG